MPKISIYVTTKLQKKMDSAPKRNWSRVAAEAFEKDLMTPAELIENERLKDICKEVFRLSRIET